MTNPPTPTPDHSKPPGSRAVVGGGSVGGADHAALAPDLRVILVGRSRLDAVLRRDPRLELLRVRTPLEAVGELADPIDSSSPGRAAVILSPTAHPESEGDAAGDFVAALRLIDPSASVLVEAPGVSGRPASPYDGTIRPEATPDEVREVVDRIALTRAGWVDAPAARPAAVGAPVRVAQAFAPGRPLPREESPVSSNQSAHAASASASPSAAVGGSAGDDRLVVRALLAGRDPLLPALDLIRARTGVMDAAFVPAVDAQGKAGAAPAEGAAVTLAVPGAPARVLGWLRSATRPGSALAGQAEWLAVWIALMEQQATLRQAALVDDLTGAYNRRYFDRYMQQAIEHARAHRRPITLMVFDIDDFKTFNDRYGHPAGDQILREAVLLLRSVIRPSDRVCRIGGDEFAVIFYDASGPRDPSSKPPDDPQTIARRFQQQIREHRFPKLGSDAPGTLTISAGLATYPWDGQSATELVARADALALESKRAGKNALRMGPGSE